ncbi:MAG TPA: OsmC family protein [Candidatus Limnocylindria bacterium]|nr:OsmC family protein [Candidatus Limnocylindria bacterium]
MSAEIRQAIEAALAYLGEHPEEARYTDSQATATITQGLQATVSGPDGAKLTTDMPASVGGQNSAPSPGWFLRAAEASCTATLIAMRAAQLGVTLTRVEVTVDSESDDRGILGMDDDTPAGPLSTRVVARVSAPGTDPMVVDDIVKWAVAHCPVTDAVRRAVPLSVEVQAT